MPLLVVSFLTRFFGPSRRFADGLRLWRFCLFAAFAMTVPYLIIAATIGPELPSLLGGLVGLAMRRRLRT